MKNWISEELYKEILENIPICCVDVAVLDGNRVLLVKRKDEPAKDHWWIPGGRIYKNEKLKDAAIRKVYEETGIKIKIKKLIGTYEFFWHKGFFSALRTGAHTIDVTFLAEPLNKDPKIKLDKASSDYKWINRIEEDFHPYIIKVLKDSKILD